MLKNKFYPFLILSILALFGCCHSQRRDVLYQVSTIQALSAGDYDGKASLCRLRRHGDFGIGTFQGLDGEMLALDGVFYQVKADGRVYPVDQASRIPFAQVTFFDADKTFVIDDELNYAELTRHLDKLLPSKNIFYAVKISGLFKYVQIRSVPKQSPPYPKLDQALKGQKVFEFYDIRGTMVGWRSPQCSEKIGVPGYHMHFISEDKLKGGHVLDFKTGGVKAELDETNDFYLSLPDNPEFLDLDLGAATEGIDAKKI
ncbi:acetolactate decarboxylase [bacterium]|nr:MAG: acetolactate decarboxylase [bacterium]